MPVYTPELVLASFFTAVAVAALVSEEFQFKVKSYIRAFRIWLSNLLYNLGDRIHNVAYRIDTDW